MSTRSLSPRRRRVVGIPVRTIVAVAALIVAAPLNAGPGAIPAGNLVKNPGFEDGPGRADDLTSPPAVWQSGGTPSVWVYVDGVGYERPPKSVAAKIGGGANFLSGGTGAAGTPGTLTR